MDLLPSAHADSFARDRLPAASRWPELRFDLDELRYPDRLNCAVDLLDTAIAAFGPDRRCLIGNGSNGSNSNGTGGNGTGTTNSPDTWTYGDLDRRSDQIAHVLTRDLGVVPGNRVLLCGPNSPWTVACWFGVLKAGAVVVTVVPLLRSEEIATVADIAQVSVALCAPGCDAEAAKAAEAAEKAEKTPMQVLTFGGTAPDDLLQRCAQVGDQPFEPVQTSQDDVAMIAFTSGTTGRPKGDHALPPRHPGDRRQLRARTCCKPTAGRRLHRHAAAGLHLRARRPGDLPAARRRRRRCCWKRRAPTRCSTAIETHRRHRLLHRADRLPRDARGAGRAAHDLVARCAAACRPARRCRPRPGEAWHDATGIKIIDGIGATEMLHIFISAADDDIRPGSTGKPVPGYAGRDPRRGRADPSADGEPSAGSPCAARPAAATWPTSARRTMCGTAGTSPATPTSATRTATSGTRRAPTT